ncbi:MAG: hypothetical protein Q4Q07_05110 [Tissierellia bacterium]|nr:hypothetical protein [Tissierellia bacterium]
MNRKLKNIVIFGIFLLLLFLSTFSSFFGTEYNWPLASNRSTSFDGLIFDEPANVSNLNVTRSVREEEGNVLIKYDVGFSYTGEPSNMRILGTPVRQIYFPEDVQPRKSNVTLKGEYGKVNENLFTKLKLKDLYTKRDDYGFTTNSELRVPMREAIKDYKFTVYESPRSLVYRGKTKLADTAVFLTNGRIEKFTDAKLAEEKSGISPSTKTDSQSGLYINSLELIHDKAVKNLSLVANINSVLFIGSTLVLLVLLWLDKEKLQPLYMVLMMIILVTFHRFIDSGVSTKAVLLIYPIYAFIAACLSKLMGKDEIWLSKNELKQSIGFTIIFFVLILIIIIIPRAF